MIEKALNYTWRTILICLALTQIVWCFWAMATGYDDLTPAQQIQAGKNFPYLHR